MGCRMFVNKCCQQVTKHFSIELRATFILHQNHWTVLSTSDINILVLSFYIHFRITGYCIRYTVHCIHICGFFRFHPFAATNIPSVVDVQWVSLFQVHTVSFACPHAFHFVVLFADMEGLFHSKLITLIAPNDAQDAIKRAILECNTHRDGETLKTSMRALAQIFHYPSHIEEYIRDVLLGSGNVSVRFESNTTTWSVEDMPRVDDIMSSVITDIPDAIRQPVVELIAPDVQKYASEWVETRKAADKRRIDDEDQQRAKVIAAENRRIADQQAFRNVKLAAKQAANEHEKAMHETKLTAEKALQESKLATEKALQESKLVTEKALQETKLATERTTIADEEALRKTKLAVEKAMQEMKLAAEKAALDDEQAARKVRILQSMGSALPAEEIQRQMLQILHGAPPKRHASPDDAQSQPKRRCTPEANKSVDEQLAALDHARYHGKQSQDWAHPVWKLEEK